MVAYMYMYAWNTSWVPGKNVEWSTINLIELAPNCSTWFPLSKFYVTDSAGHLYSKQAVNKTIRPCFGTIFFLFSWQKLFLATVRQNLSYWNLSSCCRFCTWTGFLMRKKLYRRMGRLFWEVDISTKSLSIPWK